MTSQSPPSGPFDDAQSGDAQPPNGSPEGQIDPDATLIRGPLPDFAVDAATAESGVSQGTARRRSHRVQIHISLIVRASQIPVPFLV